MKEIIVLLTTSILIQVANGWPGGSTHHEEPINWNVHFESGKESVALYDRASSMFQRRHLKVQNLMGPSLPVDISCEDRFSKFSTNNLNFGDVWEFTVYDWFSRRHYWCTADAANGRKYSFRAYGEGAPRGHNRVVLLSTGALINGRNVTME